MLRDSLVSPAQVSQKLWLWLSVVAISTVISLLAYTPTNAQSTASTLNFSINSVINLSLANCSSAPDTDSSSLTLNVDPTSSGVFKSNCQIIAVGTNLPGYSLSVKASSPSLIYQNPTTLNPKPTIPATTGSFTTPITLTTNTWGYAVAAQKGFDASYTVDNPANKYATLATTDTEIYQTNSFPAPVSSFTAYYGTKLDLATVAGQYQTTITYSAIGEYVPCQWDNSISFEDAGCVEPDYLAKVVRDNNITTMQGLTSAICQSAIYDGTNKGVNDNNTVTLTDIRNNQDYQVRKLADDNCWMINNLRIALPDVAANPTASDPKLDNTALTALAAQISPDNSGSSYFSDQPRWYDPTCGVNGASSSNCGSTDITSSTFYGYLYNWCAAMGGTTASCTARDTYPTDLAGNPGSSTNYNPLNTASICPANWRLPTGDETGELAILNGSMYNNVLSAADTTNDAAHTTNWLYSGPFQGVFSGAWDRIFGDEGIHADLWSSSAYPSDYNYVYNVWFDSSRVYPSDFNYRSLGYAVRCVVGS